MKNLFDTSPYSEVLERLNKLNPQSERKWGKMDAAQMLAHCARTFNVPLSEKKIPRIFAGRLLGWMIKSKLYNEVPWKQNLPTSPNLMVKEQCIFEAEKAKLTELIEKFHKAGPQGISQHPHPFFGSFTSEQWGKGMYKHLDHHLQQFGV